MSPVCVASPPLFGKVCRRSVLLLWFMPAPQLVLSRQRWNSLSPLLMDRKLSAGFQSTGIFMAPSQMGCDKVDRPVSVDSWAESQMSHRTLSEAFSACYNEIRAFSNEPRWSVESIKALSPVDLCFLLPLLQGMFIISTFLHSMHSCCEYSVIIPYFFFPLDTRSLSQGHWEAIFFNNFTALT